MNFLLNKPKLDASIPLHWAIWEDMTVKGKNNLLVSQLRLMIKCGFSYSYLPFEFK